MESKELALALDLFGQAVRDMTKLEIKGAGSEPSVEYIRSGLHAELCRSDVVKVVTAEVERAVAESSIKLLQDFQPGKHTDPEHLATLMQEEICRLSEQLQPQKDKSEGL